MRIVSRIGIKLIALWGSSILVTLLLAGSVFGFLLDREFRAQARTDLDSSLDILESRLATLRGKLDTVSHDLTRRREVIAGLNLISRYQDRNDYKPLVFDEAKRKLAQQLRDLTGIGNDHILALYDANGDLTAFHVQNPQGSDSLAFVSYESDGRPVLRSGETGGEFVTLAQPPEGVALSAPEKFLDRMSNTLRVSHHRLTITVVEPIQRKRVGGESERVGTLVKTIPLTTPLLRDISLTTGLDLAYFLSDGTRVGARVDPVLPVNGGERRQIVEEPGRMAGVLTTNPEVDAKAVFVFEARRSDQLAKMDAFGQSALWSLVLIALFALPLAAFTVRRILGRPLIDLISGVEGVAAGNYGALVTFRSKDELGELAAAFNAMAAKVRDREGKLREAHDNLELLVDERTRALTQEIEERKRTEVELTESRERLNLIINSAADGIVTVSEDGSIVNVNTAAEKIFGYSAMEITGKNVNLLMPEPDRSAHDGYIRRYLETGKGNLIGSRREVQGQRKDGSTFPMELALSVTDTAHGRLFTGLITDITARKEAEAEVGKLSRAVEHSPAIVLITDPNGVVEYVNPRFTEITGYAREEIIGERPSKVKSRGTPAEEYAAMWQTISSGKVWQGEFHNRRKDGNEYWVSAAIAPITADDGTITHYVAVEEDITERKRMQIELVRAKEQAEVANRAKSEFLSRMSHELRTPLNAILGFAQLMESSRKEPLSEKQTGYVKHILQGGNHLLELINEVLDLARIEAGRLSLEFQDMEPRSLLDECLTLTATMADRRGIALTDATQGGTLPVIRADVTRTKQVLLNFLSNAVKYNVDGGSITLDAKEGGDGMLHFAVTDTGPGIPEDKQAMLFEPFARLGAENTETEGTGIGLTITKKLVEQMNGSIGFSSTPGEGSTFWFEIPLAEGGGEEATVVRDGPIDPEILAPLKCDVARTVLYIEDNRANLELVQNLADEIPNLDMIAARTAESGIEMAERLRPDALIIDINLPGMSGLEALAHLRKNERTRDIPAIALSADAMPDAVRKGREAGFADYLTKPVAVSNLLKAVCAAVHGEETEAG